MEGLMCVRVRVGVGTCIEIHLSCAVHEVWWQMADLAVIVL